MNFSVESDLPRVEVDSLISQISLNSGELSNSQDTISVKSCGESSCPMETTPLEMGRMEVNVVPAAFHRTNSHQCSQMPAYEMYRRPRGLAMIIDIEVYENNVQERRLGSNVDVENIKALLQGLEFDVRLHKNLPLAGFFKEVTEFCCDKMHNEADMTVVVILSHGKDGVVYAADGQSINMEYIYEFFNNRNCPNLRGKPKFFIVQACRGDRPDQGVEREEESYNDHLLTAGSFTQAKKRRAEALDAVACIPETGDVCRARPTWEDMIIAYSTIPGYASLRDHDNGTWFVQSLVEVFMAHAHDTELVDLLRMTSECLSHFTNEQGEKQTCNVEMRHLYKRIYFNPGLGRPPPSISRSRSNPLSGRVVEKSTFEQWGPRLNRSKTQVETAVRENEFKNLPSTAKGIRNKTRTLENLQTKFGSPDPDSDCERKQPLNIKCSNNRSSSPSEGVSTVSRVSRKRSRFLRMIYNLKNKKYGISYRGSRKGYKLSSVEPR